MVRDLGSTNGTTVNGSPLASEQSVMPDEELGIAGHLFTIDYDPAGPEAFLSSHKDLDEDVVLETAPPLAHGPCRARHRSIQSEAAQDCSDGHRALSADEAEFDDAVPEHFKAPPKPKKKQPTDDDFFKTHRR